MHLLVMLPGGVLFSLSAARWEGLVFVHSQCHFPLARVAASASFRLYLERDIFFVDATGVIHGA
jgi:hypothetical protein